MAFDSSWMAIAKERWPTSDLHVRLTTNHIRAVGRSHGYILHQDLDKRGPMPKEMLIELGYLDAVSELYPDGEVRGDKGQSGTRSTGSTTAKPRRPQRSHGTG